MDETKFKRARKAHGLTQQALAEKARVSLDTVRRVEAGVNRPSRVVSKALSDALDVPEAELFSE